MGSPPPARARLPPPGQYEGQRHDQPLVLREHGHRRGQARQHQMARLARLFVERGERPEREEEEGEGEVGVLGRAVHDEERRRQERRRGERALRRAAQPGHRVSEQRDGAHHERGAQDRGHRARLVPDQRESPRDRARPERRVAGVGPVDHLGVRPRPLLVGAHEEARPHDPEVPGVPASVRVGDGLPQPEEERQPGEPEQRGHARATPPPRGQRAGPRGGGVCPVGRDPDRADREQLRHDRQPIEERQPEEAQRAAHADTHRGADRELRPDREATREAQQAHAERGRQQQDQQRLERDGHRALRAASCACSVGGAMGW